MSGTHAFAICAYGDSPYLEECIQSVLSQSRPAAQVYLATSTPSAWLEEIARRYALPLYVNTGGTGIGADWNFAYSQASCDYVTIAHQDDVYCPKYSEIAVSMADSARHPIIFFSNYGEIHGGSFVDESRLLQVKRRMLAPLADGRRSESIATRRRAISFGNSICCPTVMFSRRACARPPFRTKMKSNLDWDTWELLSRQQGDFLYSTQILLYHRIHEASATSSLIGDNTRAAEDAEMLRRFWPAPIAGVIEHFYAEGEKGNTVS